MKQITFNYFRRLALMLLAVVGFTTTALAENWQELNDKAITFASKSPVTYYSGDNNFFFNVPSNQITSVSGYSNVGELDASPDNYYPQISNSGNALISTYFTVKQHLSPGVYKFSYRIRGWSTVAVDLFYTTDPTEHSLRNIVLEVSNTSSNGSMGPHKTNSFTIESEGDYYLGFYVKENPGNKLVTFADFRLYQDMDAAVGPTPTTYSVTVEPTNCTVSVTNTDGSAIDDLTAVPENTELKVTVNPSEGFEFGSLTYSIDGGVTDESLANEGTFILTGSATIKAVCNETVEPVEPYAQNFGQGVGAPTGNAHRSWTNTVFKTSTDGTKTVDVNYETKLT